MRPDEELKKSISVKLKNGILETSFLIPYKPSDEGLRQSELYRDAVFSELEKAPDGQKVGATVDMTAIEYVNIAPPAGANKIYMQIAKHPKVGKVAIISGRPYYRTLAKFVLIVAGKGSLFNAFANRDDAIKWLKE